ncbi:MAG: GNAT family N-acetyltransferase [Pseudomonadota bacterium]
MQRLDFDVFGKQVQTRRTGDVWEVRYVGPEGKQRPAPDIRVPTGISAHEVAGALADLCHEWATARHSSVTLKRSAIEVVSVDARPVTLTMRPAQPRDLETLRYWDTRAHIMASDPNDDWQWETELHKQPDWREQLIAEVDGKPIGFVEIIDPALEDSHYWGEVATDLRAVDIWIGEVDYLRRGFGTLMMKDALMRCFAPPAITGVLIDPLETNERALQFYRGLGFEWVEARRFGADDCAVHHMSRAVYLSRHADQD